MLDKIFILGVVVFTIGLAIGLWVPIMLGFIEIFKTAAGG